MEIMGTNFTITLGSWRLRLGFSIDDVDAPVRPNEVPHRVRIVPDDSFTRARSLDDEPVRVTGARVGEPVGAER